MAEDKKEKDMHIANSSFYSNNFVIQVNGTEVFIDFQRYSPRFEVSEFKKLQDVTEHSTIILNIVFFKQLIKLGSNLIKDLEKRFGDISTPEFLKKLSQEQKKALAKLEKAASVKQDDRPPYMG